MAERDSPSPLDDLDARLRVARKGLERDQHSYARRGGANAGYRIGVEIIAGVFGGAGIGWLLDTWLGTRPWLMMALLFMGFAAGLLNAFRAARRMSDDTGQAGPDRH